jgi:hypothetical protein
MGFANQATNRQGSGHVGRPKATGGLRSQPYRAPIRCIQTEQFGFGRCGPKPMNARLTLNRNKASEEGNEPKSKEQGIPLRERSSEDRRVEPQRSSISLPPTPNKHPNTRLTSREGWLPKLLDFNRHHGLVRCHHRLSLRMLY